VILAEKLNQHAGLRQSIGDELAQARSARGQSKSLLSRLLPTELA